MIVFVSPFFTIGSPRIFLECSDINVLIIVTDKQKNSLTMAPTLTTRHYENTLAMQYSTKQKNQMRKRAAV